MIDFAFLGFPTCIFGYEQGDLGFHEGIPKYLWPQKHSSGTPVTISQLGDRTHVPGTHGCQGEHGPLIHPSTSWSLCGLGRNQMVSWEMRSCLDPELDLILLLCRNGHSCEKLPVHSDLALT